MLIDSKECENENGKLIVKFDNIEKIVYNVVVVLPLSLEPWSNQLNIMSSGVLEPFYYK